MMFKSIITATEVAKHVSAMALLSRFNRATCAASYVEEHANQRGQSIALKQDDKRFTWSQVNHEANRVASFFSSQGFKSGDCVAFVAENSAQAFFCLIGLNKIGVISALINAQLTGDALAHVIQSCQPKALLIDPEFKPAIDQISRHQSFDVFSLSNAESGLPALTDQLPDVHVNPASTKHQRASDVMLYLFTSGTTGLPKAAIIRNQRFLTTAHGFAGVVAQVNDSDVIYLTLPMYHATGAIAAMGTAIVSGASLALRRKFSVREFWSDCVRYEATLFNYIGEICRYLLAAPSHPQERAHRLRGIMGAGMRADIWSDFQQRFNIPRIVEFYGATEGNIALINMENKPGMMGRLMPGQQIVLIDEETEEFLRNADDHLQAAKPGQQGMLIGRISQSTRFDGYLDSSKNNDKILKNPFGNGVDYFNSGDLVQLHNGRWVSFADRLGDTYRWKGENISTIEVSNLLNKCHGVIESVVYGVEVTDLEGKAGMAAVVAEQDIDIEQLSREIHDHLPSPLRPLFIRQCQQLEKTASFKYLKHPLRQAGFDPAVCGHNLWVQTSNKAGYEQLTPAIYQDILSGNRRL